MTKYLHEIDDDENPMKSLTKAVAGRTRWRVLAIVFLAVIIAGILLLANIKKEIEIDVRVGFEKQILDLENEVEKVKTEYEDKLTDQKADYEKKLTTEQEKHNKEIEKKENIIAEKDAEIERLKAENMISFDEIETEIKTVGKLTTIDYHYTYAGTHEDVDTFFKTNIENPLTKNSFIAQWDGVIAIGVDLSKVIIDVNEANKIVTVSIPAAEIFYHDVDEDSFEVLDQKNNIFNPIDVVDKVEFDKKYEKKIYEKITDNRMIEDAYENAKTMIENMLSAVAQDYKIEFQQIK